MAERPNLFEESEDIDLTAFAPRSAPPRGGFSSPSRPSRCGSTGLRSNSAARCSNAARAAFWRSLAPASAAPSSSGCWML